MIFTSPARREMSREAQVTGKTGNGLIHGFRGYETAPHPNPLPVSTGRQSRRASWRGRIEFRRKDFIQ
jgi:hypothetical protein